MTSKKQTDAHLVSLEKILDEIIEQTPNYGLPSLSTLPFKEALSIRALRNDIDRAKDWAGIRDDHLHGVYYALKIIIIKGKLTSEQKEILSALRQTGRSLLGIALVGEQPN